MINFYELEKKCKKKKLKLILKVAGIISSIAILSGIVFLFLLYRHNHKNTEAKIIQNNIEKKTIEVVKHPHTEIKKVEQKVIKVVKVVKEKPKIPEITYMLDLGNISVTNEPKSIKRIKKSVIKKPEIKKEKKPEPEKVNTPVLTTSSLTLQTALFKIKNFYDNGDFDNTIKWCKLASKIDNKNEDIWSYYALSLYKTGQKNKAIEVLKTYLKYKKSQKIEKILKRLK